MEGNCLAKNIVYQATVKHGDISATYIGITRNTFKTRLADHKTRIKHENLSSGCRLAKYIWDLKNKNIKYDISWKIIARASTFSSITNICNLCVNEKYQILYFPERASINSRNEITGYCRHKLKHLIDKG